MNWLLLFPTFWVSLTVAHNPVIISNHDLATKLYNEISKVERSNLLFSPASLLNALALLQTGAKDATAKEMQRTFNLGKTRKEITDLFQHSKSLFNSEKPFLLHSENKVYVRPCFMINDSFRETAVRVFHSEIANINFANKIDAANEINKWVEDKTEKRVKHLFSPDEFNTNMVTILVNTLHFKANWQKNFTSVGKSDFFVAGKKKVGVEAMQLETVLLYHEVDDIDAKLVDVPLEGSGLIFTIVLPNKINGLGKVEKNLFRVYMSSCRRPRYMSLLLPKFKAAKKTDFKQTLQKLGVKTMFTNKADLSGMVDITGKVDKVIQESYISVNENGVNVAGNATDLDCVDFRGFRPTMELKVDHPFFFYIHLKGNILLSGRIVDPLA